MPDLRMELLELAYLVDDEKLHDTSCIDCGGELEPERAPTCADCGHGVCRGCVDENDFGEERCQQCSWGAR